MPIPIAEQREAVEEAIRILIDSGMVMRYQNQFATSFYLGWPGRNGTLRVSDHRTRRRVASSIYARITLSETFCRTTEGGMAKACALALGRYLAKAPVAVAPDAPAP